MNEEKKKNLLIICLIIIILMLSTLIILLSTGVINPNVNEIIQEKNYVYDADYKYNNKYTESKRFSYNEETGKKTIDQYGISVEYNNGTQYLEDLKVPYINLNSNDATTANNEIKQLYEEYAKFFDSCAEEAIYGCSLILTYRTYTYNNILSIVIIYGSQSTSPWNLNYKTYNFDITTGNKLTYNETLSKLGYDNKSTTTKAKEKIKNKMDEIWKPYAKDLTTECSNNTNCYDKANELIETSIKDNSILFFVNNEGKLNLLLIAYYDVIQTGTDHYLIEIDK